MSIRISTRARRFIPARAGNTIRCTRSSGLTPVHPRPRGEHTNTKNFRCGTAGSSPPARGTLQVCDPLPPWIRFIPARAGNTLAQPSPEPFVPVHPRPRGEHWTPLALTVLYPGSSPPARGTHHTDAQLQRGPRFIPARAGNTAASPHIVGSTAVHPRPRGEHLQNSGREQMIDGSSPPARGTLAPVAPQAWSSRFIPARAGNTVAVLLNADIVPVHPRPRGEHPTSTLVRIGHPHPRPRGEHLKWSRKVMPVHPRPRGEHFQHDSPKRPYVGSSPPARGTLKQLHDVCLDVRFIPARAGNTLQPLTSLGLSPLGSSPPARGTRQTRAIPARIRR